MSFLQVSGLWTCIGVLGGGRGHTIPRDTRVKGLLANLRSRLCTHPIQLFEFRAILVTDCSCP